MADARSLPSSGIQLANWQIRRDERMDWQPIRVPGCWEDAGWPVDDPGPFTYRTTVDIPAAFSWRRIWLRFSAASYDCRILVDGQLVGRHTGTWDPFEIEITRVAHPGQTVELTAIVEKPASPTAGPDSPAVPGRFPLRQALAGFLPYVWGHAFGGLWQPVTLFSTGLRRLGNVCVRGTAEGRVSINAEIMGPPAPVTIAIDDPRGEPVVRCTAEGDPTVEWAGQVPNPQPWSPDRPALYTAHLSVPDGEERRVRFGLRSITTDGPSIVLNGQPIYPRLALSWGWRPDGHCPSQAPERIRADLLRLREAGFNGVKLCLWFPPAAYFDAADELGMLVWLELPMWLPEPSPHFQQQTPIEYERLVRAARQHPSVVIYTLGCELNRAVAAPFLADLFHRLKALAGDALARDNSGSGEAYGGWLAESADFYDHHFYSDAQFLGPLLDVFAPSWRTPLPWLMGEFGDYDTLRDWPAILEANAGRLPWWADPDPRVNPQGARWEMRTAGHVDKLKQSGLWDALPALLPAACRQGLLHRKLTLEKVRARPQVSGYVVTGEVDTPVSTAGLWDDLGRDKLDPAAFKSFNDDLVLVLGHHRRRDWVAGGDRPAYWDHYSVRGGATARAHLLASNLAVSGPARVVWEAALPGGPALAGGEAEVELVHGQIGELAVIEFVAPNEDRPRRVEIRARLDAGGRSWTNAWPLWVYPRDAWQGVAPFTLFDPAGALVDLPGLVPGRCHVRLPGRRLDRRRVVVCTAWSPAVDRLVKAGGRAVVLQQRHGPPGPLPVIECPYWREALKIAEPHAAWGDFPHEGDPAQQFYAMAPDCALDGARRPGQVTPLLRRLDTRSLEMLEYAAVVEWGAGRLIATALRLQGGLGDEPSGISWSPGAAYLLAAWLRYLEASWIW